MAQIFPQLGRPEMMPANSVPAQKDPQQEVPKGKNIGKMARGQLALQGLIGAK